MEAKWLAESQDVAEAIGADKISAAIKVRLVHFLVFQEVPRMIQGVF